MQGKWTASRRWNTGVGALSYGSTIGNTARKRDEEKKLHPDLLPWNQLDREERYIDQEMMKTIVVALDAVGYGVYRARSMTKTDFSVQSQASERS